MSAPKSKRGFASMDPEKQKAIASAGGKVAHSKGTAHQWTSEEAKAAGQKGWAARRANKIAQTAEAELVQHGFTKI